MFKTLPAGSDFFQLVMGPRFLVTTSYSILLLDVQSGEITPIERGRGLYYGITQHDGYFYVAARGRMVSSDIPARDERGEIVILNDRLEISGTLTAPFPLRDMHEIQWHAGRLWVTCAFDDMIAIFDGKSWETWHPLGMPTTEPYDLHHFNSFGFENETVIVLAHNWGASMLHFFTLSTLRQIGSLPLGIEAHNIWKENGEYCTCSSGEGRLVGEEKFTILTGGFPRGVAACDGVRCIGVSERAERAERDFTTGIIQVYDSSWRAISEIPLVGEGLVLDLRPYHPPVH